MVQGAGGGGGGYGGGIAYGPANEHDVKPANNIKICEQKQHQQRHGQEGGGGGVKDPRETCGRRICENQGQAGGLTQ